MGRNALVLTLATVTSLLEKSVLLIRQRNQVGGGDLPSALRRIPLDRDLRLLNVANECVPWI